MSLITCIMAACLVGQGVANSPPRTEAELIRELDRLAEQIDRSRVNPSAHAAAALIRECMERFPESDNLSRIVGRWVWVLESAKAVEPLREPCKRFMRDHPNAPAATSVRFSVEAWFDLRFAQVSEYLQSGTNDAIDADCTRDLRRKFTLYSIDGEAYRTSLENAAITYSELDAIPFRIPRARWRPAHDLRLEEKGDRDWIHVSGWRNSRLVSAARLNPGIYIVDEQIEGFHNYHTVRVCTFTLLCKTIGGRGFAFAVDREPAQPVAGIRVLIRTKDRVFEGTTDAEGLLPIECREPAIVTAMRGDELQACYFDATPSKQMSLVHIATDRPIYRPGQTVHYRVVARERSEQGLALPKSAAIPVEIRDPDGRVLQKATHDWTAFGTLSGSFQIADEPPLGDFWICVPLKRADAPSWWWRQFGGQESEEESDYWRVRFSVAEYRKPNVRVSIRRLDDEKGGAPRFEVTAERYVGGPVRAASVRWTAGQLWWWNRRDDLDDFGDDGLTEPADRLAWFSEPDREYNPFHWEDFRPDDVVEGEGQTDENGRFVFSVPPDELPPEGEFLITAEVKDETRLSAFGESKFWIDRSGIDVQITTDRWDYAAGDRARVQVRITKPNGEPASDRDVQFMAVVWKKLGPPLDDPALVDTTVKTGRDGIATFEAVIPTKTEGDIVFHASVQGNDGRLVRRTAERSFTLELPFSDLEIAIERPTYKIGETMKVTVPSGPPGVALLTCEGREIDYVRVIKIGPTPTTLDIVIRPEWAPSIDVKFVCWKAKGEWRVDYKRVYIVPKASFVDVSVVPEQKHYSPGNKAKFSVATSLEGKPIAAELEFGVIDASILDLAPDRTHDIRLRFFSPWVDPIQFGSIGPYPDYLDERANLRREIGFGGYGGGGLGGGAWAENGGRRGLDQLAPTTVRSNFPDTWFWSGRIETSAEGKTKLELDVPDSLTKWRIVARAVTKDHKFGRSISEVVTKKPVMIQLAPTRFYTEGDRGTVAAVLRNDLDIEEEFLVRLHSGEAGEKLTEQRVKIAPKTERRFDVPVSVPKAGQIKLKAEALSKTASDAMEATVPVRPYGLVVPTAKAGRVEDVWTRTFFIPQGSDLATATLDVYVATPGIVAVREALPYLAGYPYGCVEQTMSRFVPAVVASGAFRRLGVKNEQLERDLPDMIRQGLNRLYRFQHGDGGWGWWEHDATSNYMTTYVLWGLLQAKAAGIDVDAMTLKRGLRSIEEQPTPFGCYVRMLAGEEPVDWTKADLQSDRNRAYRVLATKRMDGLELLRKPPSKTDHESIANVALTIMARHAVNPNDPATGPLVDWLLRQRQGSAWNTTLDSAYATLALTAIAERAEEAKVEVAINGQSAVRQNENGPFRVAALRHGENRVDVKRLAGRNVYASARLGYFDKGVRFPGERDLAARSPIRIDRFVEVEEIKRNERLNWRRLASGDAIRLSDRLRIRLVVFTSRDVERLLFESPFPAGTEAATDDLDDDGWNDSWYCREEIRDDRVAIAVPEMSRGERLEFITWLRPTHPGEYRVLPAVVLPMYSPEERAASEPFVLRIED